MVLTRSQASKNKANQSPEPSAPKVTKQARKPRSGGGKDAAADEEQAPSTSSSHPLSDRPPLNTSSAMGQRMSRHNAGPTSHPIASLPASPGGSAGQDFTIPVAQQQQQQQELRQALAALPEASQGQQAAGTALPAAAADPSATAKAPCPQQHAQPPLPQPRPEKLLKRLPDKAVPCDKLPDGPEPVVIEVEYFSRDDLQPVEDTAATLAAAVPGLEAGEWVETIKALNLLRQLIVHHPDACSSQLDTLMPLVLKSVRSLRSSVCKTAIMAVADLYQSFGNLLLPHTDGGGQLKPVTSLLAQLLLKCSSNDKKFVIEEAQRALQVMIDNLTPGELLTLLLPYADVHKNMKVRGKAGMAAAEAVARMQSLDMLAFGLPRLLQVSGKLVTDNTPDARDSAKKLIGMMRAAFSDAAVEQQLAVEVPPPAAAAEGEEPPKQPSKWEFYCQSNLSGSAALAVLKASSD